MERCAACVCCLGAAHAVLTQLLRIWQALAHAAGWHLDDRVHMSVLVASQGLLQREFRW
jgi:hypothetical protein